MNTSQVLVVIPARYASTRFPGKPLVQIAGKSMIHRVHEQCQQAKRVQQVIIATDDQRIFDEVISFGGQVQLTKISHPSGTDRCAEVAAQFPDIDIVVNVQGDEPFIAPQMIDQVIAILQNNREVSIATLVKKIDQSTDIFNPNVVKAVFNQQNEALYFSRHPIPYQRGVEETDWLSKSDFYRHIGIYAFRQKTLIEVAALSPSALEKAESLEQLRWLDNGYRIGVDITEWESVGIDSPEDLEKLNL